MLYAQPGNKTQLIPTSSCTYALRFSEYKFFCEIKQYLELPVIFSPMNNACHRYRYAVKSNNHDLETWISHEMEMPFSEFYIKNVLHVEIKP